MHRLAYSFGWDGSEAVPPGSSLIEIDLIEQPDGTLLRLTRTGLPDTEAGAGHAKGWAHYFGRLGEVAAGRNPGTDPWHGRTGGGAVTALPDAFEDHREILSRLSGLGKFTTGRSWPRAVHCNRQRFGRSRPFFWPLPVQEPDIQLGCSHYPRLLNHPVRAQQRGLRNRDAKLTRGRKIHRQAYSAERLCRKIWQGPQRDSIGTASVVLKDY